MYVYGDGYVIEARIEAPAHPAYLRLRGTSTAEQEPAPDFVGEDPWSDLWFYSGAIYFAPR